MSRNRFESILEALRYTDEEPPTYIDKFHSVRQLISEWNSNIQQNFIPGWISYIMLVDFFTKPLQGSLFRLFRSVIMGHEDIEVLFKLDRIKERVGKQLILPDMNQESKNEERRK